MSNFLISGANGFIGNSFYNTFKKKDLIYKISLNKNSKNYINIRTQQGYDYLKNFLKKKKIRYFINFGWAATNDLKSEKHLSENFKNFKILAKICDESKIEKFVSLGSIDEYNKKKIINEKKETLDLNKKKNLYAISKILSYHYLNENYNHSYLHLRIPNVYGFKKEKKFLINKIFIDALNDNKTIKLKNVNQQRIYLFVDDLVKYIRSISINKKNKGLFNIGCGTSISIYEYLKIYEKLLRKSGINIAIQNVDNQNLTRFKFYSNYIIFSNYKKKLKKNLIKVIKDQIKYFKKIN
jgi:nucleoside-diphosphate-sugar epimerase